MDWSDVGKKIISVGAPLLGGALGGPAGAAIGQVVASQFGLTEASPDKVLEAITADPEARLKLTELEFRHSERLIKLENEYFKLQPATGYRGLISTTLSRMVTISISGIRLSGKLKQKSPTRESRAMIGIS